MNKNQTIKCNVYECKYNDLDTITCSLKQIKVCSLDKNNSKESTMCDSYKAKNE